MNRTEFLNAVIDDGIVSVTMTYTKPEDHLKLEGSIEGFEACRGKNNQELFQIYERAKAATIRAADTDIVDYWSVRYRELQIEWTLNVLSCAYLVHGLRTLVEPTQRGMQKAKEILS